LSSSSSSHFDLCCHSPELEKNDWAVNNDEDDTVETGIELISSRSVRRAADRLITALHFSHPKDLGLILESTAFPKM